MRLNVSGSTTDLMLDYMTPLASSLTKPLVHKDAEGVSDVIKVLNEYDLMKDDMDSILELNTWPGKPDPMAAVASKVWNLRICDRCSNFKTTSNSEIHYHYYYM